LISKLKSKKCAETSAETLASIGKPAVIPLTAATKNKNEDVARWASAALEAMRDLE